MLLIDFTVDLFSCLQEDVLCLLFDVGRDVDCGIDFVECKTYRFAELSACPGWKSLDVRLVVRDVFEWLACRKITDVTKKLVLNVVAVVEMAAALVG